MNATIRRVTYLGATEQYALELASGAVIRAVEANPVAIRRPGENMQIHLQPRDIFVLAM